MKTDLLLAAIRAQMTALDIGPYELAQRLKGRVSQATIYNYVKNGKPAKSDTIVEVMTVLGLIVTAAPDKEVRRERELTKRR